MSDPLPRLGARSSTPVTVATWLYAESEAEQSHYPRVVGEGASSSERFQAVYWRYAVASLATSRRMNPAARHRFYTNLETLPRVDGHDGRFLNVSSRSLETLAREGLAGERAVLHDAQAD